MTARKVFQSITLHISHPKISHSRLRSSEGQVIPILGIWNIWIVSGNWTSEFQIKVMDKQKILRSLSPCFTPKEVLLKLKGCVHYIFSSLVSMSNREHLWNKEKCFLSHFKSSFCSWDNQILIFHIFKCHDIIKCLNMKHIFLNNLRSKHSLVMKFGQLI